MGHPQTFILPIVSFFLLAANLDSARALDVPNFSFETPGAGDQGVAQNGDYIGFNDPSSTFVPDWNFNDPAGYSGTVSTRFPSAPAGTADGSRIAFLNIDDSSAATITSDSPVATLIGDTNYELTVAVGNSPGTGAYLDPGTVYLNLLAVPNGGSSIVAVYAEVDESDIPDGTIKNFTLTLTAAEAQPYLGDGLEIQLEGQDPTASSSNTYQPVFDNVRLTSSSVPEPATWSALLAGLGLIVVMRSSRFCRI